MGIRFTENPAGRASINFATNPRARLQTSGLIEATLAEVLEGTSHNRYVSPYDLAALGLVGASVTVTTATYVIQSTDLYVYVNRAGAVTLTLADAATWLAANPILGLTVQDISGAASSNNITINRAGSDTVNGLTSLLINSNYGGYRLRPAATNLWIIQ